MKEKMSKTLESTKSKLVTVRTGRANPDILSRIQVEYYGSLVPIKQLANITTADSHTLVINVFDKSAIENVEKSIQKSDLNINPQTEGSIIRLRLPELTQDRRKKLIKIINQIAEEGKIALRNIRRDSLETFKKSESYTDDSYKHLQNEAQKIINLFTENIDSLIKEKEHDLMNL